MKQHSTVIKRAQVRMSEELYKELEKRAKAQNLSVYTYGGDLLERALIYEAKEATDELLAPHIRQAVRQELDRMTEAMSAMMLRIYLEAGTGRRLTQASMMLAPQQSKERIINLEKRNWESAFKELREDTKGVRAWRRTLWGEQPTVEQETASEDASEGNKLAHAEAVSDTSSTRGE